MKALWINYHTLLNLCLYFSFVVLFGLTVTVSEAAGFMVVIGISLTDYMITLANYILKHVY